MTMSREGPDGRKKGHLAEKDPSDDGRGFAKKLKEKWEMADNSIDIERLRRDMADECMAASLTTGFLLIIVYNNIRYAKETSTMGTVPEDCWRPYFDRRDRNRNEKSNSYFSSSIVCSLNERMREYAGDSVRISRVICE